MFALCSEVSKTSHDPHRQVGCVITDSNGNVLVTGSNQLPIGISVTKEKVSRPKKYLWIEHAERNAIYEAVQYIFKVFDDLFGLCLDVHGLY